MIVVVPLCAVIGGNVGLVAGFLFNALLSGETSGGPAVPVAGVAVVCAVLGLLLSPAASVMLIRAEKRWAAHDEV